MMRMKRVRVLMRVQGVRVFEADTENVRSA